MDAHMRMMDKFLDKLFEKREPLTEEEVDDIYQEEQAILMVWTSVGSFKKLIITQAGQRGILVKLAQVLEKAGYEVSVQ
jgi:hypothetical protein